MWLFGEENHGVIGFLADGDVLLPLSIRGKCNQVKARLRPARH
jgi:D-arabinose 5-phosphate isomerase GutQ